MRNLVVLFMLIVMTGMIGCNKDCSDLVPCPQVTKCEDQKPEVPTAPIVVEDEKPNDPSSPINPKLLKPSEKGWFYSSYIAENIRKYPNLLKYNKSVKYWDAFLYGMARAESGLNPKAVYWEKTMKGSGSNKRGYFKSNGKYYKYLSEGLFQLSVSDGKYRPKYCVFDQNDINKKETDSSKTIFIPKNQIDCTLHIVDWLIAKYKTPFTNKGNYWAVLMPRKTAGHARFQKYFKLQFAK
ncbi:MAG: hypothetical protein ACTSU7_06975 [Candidatus Heimdallarchaeaceae archaeon]